MDHCGTDISAIFEAAEDLPGPCIPRHTRGGLNAISGYVVGVVEGSDVDPCVHTPPDPCDALHMPYLTLENAPGVCPIAILGKIYDLAEFAPYHHGGANQIERRCG